ncbi:alpha/beta fold hydrolase [Haloechinothrix sp. YIM 98757]|uniref:Alpha/beta fold hydrolase n=1 Tax=Haloechinothrix aidingensis TaxID=2752311 RepID=A0A838AA84_9PSEU|nr:alpha/beta fold hydrolase [Haloechinothrix aidingensis]
MPPARLRGRAGRVPALAVAAATLLAGCVPGPSERPAVIAQDDPVTGDSDEIEDEVPLPTLERPEHPGVSWQDCEGDARDRIDEQDVPGSMRVDCAMVSSVLDPPGLPDRGMIRLSLTRIGNGDIPLLVVNDVGGLPGGVYAARLAGQLPEEMLETFSLVGVDRRYTGRSNPNECIEPDTRERMLGFDPAAEDLKPLIDTAGSAGQQCTIELGNEQGALDSWRSAGDLEHIREQLGMSRLHAIGRGDGSQVLDLYAQRYPDTVGRFIVDGIPDPADDHAAKLEGIAEGTQDAFEAFAADCSRNDCPLDDAEAAVTELTGELRADPLRTPQGELMGPALALRAIRAGLADRERWPELAEGIGDALDGDAAGLATFSEPMLHATINGPPTVDTAWGTRCNDTPTRLSPDRINETSAEWRERFPVFGGLVAQRLAWCAPWPTVEEQPAEGITDEVPPILVVTTAADPVTPEEGSQRRAMQMPTSVTLSWQGAGHGAIGRSGCVNERVHGFLADGDVPADGTPCPA